MSGTGKRPKQPQGKKRTPHRVTWAQSVRDVLIAAMNRGQLPLLAVAAIFFAMVWRMPPEDVSALATRIVDALIDANLGGWVLSVVLVAGWFVHARYMRQQYSAEYDRIGAEKAELQAKKAGSTFAGSQRKRR